MDKTTEVLIEMAALMLTALVAFAVYKWWQRRHVHRVEGWVKEYLVVRYGEVPPQLHINCSDDRLWPVFVEFSHPRTRTRRSLQFACPGSHSTFSLLAEKEEPR